MSTGENLLRHSIIAARALPIKTEGNLIYRGWGREGGSDRHLHSVFRQNDFAGKFLAAFSKDVMALEDGVEVSQEEFLARSFPRNPAGQGRGEVTFLFPLALP